MKDGIREFSLKGSGVGGGGEIRDCNCDRGTVLRCGNRGMSFKVFSLPTVGSTLSHDLFGRKKCLTQYLPLALRKRDAQERKYFAFV